MTAATGTVDGAELRSVAESLLDRLEPDDVGDVVGRQTSSRDALVDALAHRAALARAALHRGGEPVPAARRGLLVLACLTFNRKSGGVQQRTDRAVEAYRRYSRYPRTSPEDLAMVMARHPNEFDELVPLLERVNQLRDALDAAGATDPPFVLDVVLPAVAMALERTGAATGADDGPAAARRVLDRGAELADRHRGCGPPAPATHLGLPVLGNVDFLLRMAGYRVALDELAGGTATAGRPELEATARALADSMYRAMTTVVGRLRRRRGTGDPDVLAAFDQYAEDLGAVGGTRKHEGRLVRLAYVLRTRHLRSRRPADTDPESGLPSSPDPTPELDELDLLVRSLVAGLFERAAPALHDTILEWLRAEREPDRPHRLPELVSALRVAIARLAELERQPGHSPPSIIGLSGRELTGIVERMSAAVQRSGLSGSRQADTLRVADLALPPLWTRRRPAVRLLAGHRRSGRHRGDDPDRVLVLARAAVRAPVQFFKPDNAADPCCDTDDRPGGDVRSRPAVDGARACPHRPWGELGLLDNYRTIRADTDYSAEAVRKLLSRYRGPDREWLLGIQPELRPDDC